MSGPRLSITPAGAIFDRTLEPRDLQVLNLLGCYTDKAGWCRRSQVKMAVQLACGRASVQRSLERLVTAGWVEKKRPPYGSQTEQPSNSYMYRVVLDRDDYAFESAVDEASESHAENASEADDCPRVGTPREAISDSQIADENTSEGAQHDGHPGAHPERAPGAQPYVGTKNVPLERPPLERERDARARDRRARFLVDFEARWPTAAADNRQRTAYAAGELTEDEETAALAGIAPFLENQKRLGRKNVPAGWRYLEEKRWTLLEAAKEAAGSAFATFALDSAEAKAIGILHDIAGKSAFFYSVMRRPVGVSYSRPMTARLLALTQAPPSAEWIELNHQQAGAWEELLRESITVQARAHLHEGSRAPWPWPPRKDGTLSATGPPETQLSEQDMADFK